MRVNPIPFYELTLRILSFEVLLVVWITTAVLLILTERKLDTGRHYAPLFFVVLWMSFEIFALSGEVPQIALAALTRYARFFTAFVVAWLAWGDLRR